MVECSLIESHWKGQNYFVMGIDGFRGSGKTTVIKELVANWKERVPVVVFDLNDFLRLKKDRINTGYPLWYEYLFLHWDVQEIKKRLLEPMNQGRSELSLLYYNDKKDVFEEKGISLPESALILIEGVFLQRFEWRRFFDFVIYLDCEREERFQRLNEQIDFASVGLAEDYYLKQFQPQKTADQVIQTGKKEKLIQE